MLKGVMVCKGLIAFFFTSIWYCCRSIDEGYLSAHVELDVSKITKEMIIIVFC